MSFEPSCDSSGLLAPQFDNTQQQREARELGMWVFLCSELMLFSGLFLAYAIYRSQDEAAFAAASRRLDLFWGTVNTAVLLTSSLTMALALAADTAVNPDRKRLTALLAATIGLGMLFLAIKGAEYHHKYAHGLMPLLGLPFQWEGPGADHAQLFFDLYFVMTGIHAAHLLIGLGVLAALLIKTRRSGPSGLDGAPLHLAGLYWHFVDLVWVFLFPMLYLIGARHP